MRVPGGWNRGTGGKQRGTLPHTTHLVNGKMDREIRVYRGTWDEGGSGGGRSVSGNGVLVVVVVVVEVVVVDFIVVVDVITDENKKVHFLQAS